MNAAYIEGRIVQYTPGESLVLVRSYHPVRSLDVLRVSHDGSDDILDAFAHGRDIGISGRLRGREGGMVLEATDVHELEDATP